MPTHYYFENTHNKQDSFQLSMTWIISTFCCINQCNLLGTFYQVWSTRFLVRAAPAPAQGTSHYSVRTVTLHYGRPSLWSVSSLHTTEKIFYYAQKIYSTYRSALQEEEKNSIYTRKIVLRMNPKSLITLFNFWKCVNQFKVSIVMIYHFSHFL